MYKLIVILLTFLMIRLAHAEYSPLFEYSTDKRLMSNIEKVGVLENGLEIFSWKWNAVAQSLDKRYTNNNDESGFANIGFIAQNLQKTFSSVVEKGPEGYLKINPQKLALRDQFMRWKLSSTARTSDGRCAHVLETSFIICF